MLTFGVPTAKACPMCKDALITGTEPGAAAADRRAKAYGLSILLMVAIPFAGASAVAIFLVKNWGREEDWAVCPPRPN